MSSLRETHFQCPYCWQKISMLLEPINEPQKYIEDCEVCCQPILVNYLIQDDEVLNLNVQSIEQ